MSESATREGFIPVHGGRVFYRVFGSGDAVPLLALHGGPGFPHDYLEPLAALADERPVVLYDQLGSGRSDRPDDLGLWRMERFVQELGQVRAALGMERVHLLGHSWGTMLSADYMLTEPAGIVSLTLASPCLSIPRWKQDLDAYRQELPTDVRAALDRHEAAGTTDSAEYEEATMEFYHRHLCRLDPWPDWLLQAFSDANLNVYGTMWGPSEFFITGSLKDYDRSGTLGQIAAPTLFTCGRYDEATPATTAWYQSLVPGAELAVFEQSAHLPHAEEPQAYVTTLRAFIRRAESR